MSYKWYTLCNTHRCLVALRAVLSHKSIIYIRMIVLFLNYMYLPWLNNIVIQYQIIFIIWPERWKKYRKKILNGQFCGQRSYVFNPYTNVTVFIAYLQLGWCGFLSVDSRILCVKLYFKGVHIKGLSCKFIIKGNVNWFWMLKYTL